MQHCLSEGPGLAAPDRPGNTRTRGAGERCHPGVEGTGGFPADKGDEGHDDERHPSETGHLGSGEGKPAGDVYEPARDVVGDLRASGGKRPDQSEGHDDDAESDERKDDVRRASHPLECCVMALGLRPGIARLGRGVLGSRWRRALGAGTLPAEGSHGWQITRDTPSSLGFEGAWWRCELRAGRLWRPVKWPFRGAEGGYRRPGRLTAAPGLVTASARRSEERAAAAPPWPSTKDGWR